MIMESLRPVFERVQSDQGKEATEDELKEWAINFLIEQELFRQTAEEEFGNVDSSEIENVFSEMCSQIGSVENFLSEAGMTEDQLKEEIRSDIMQDRLKESVLSTIPEPALEDMQQYYNENIELFVQPAMADVDQIIVLVDENTSDKYAQDEIHAIAKRLNQGQDFDKLITNYSDAAKEDSYLGWFRKGEMVPKFEKVVFKMKAGQISKPFQTEFGWHIVRANSVIHEATMPFDEVKDQISQHLVLELQEQILDAYIKGKVSKAQIVR